MLTENDIVDAVADFLTQAGYRIERKLTTKQHGIDLEALHLPTGQQLLVEAKGDTSATPGTRRFGKPFSSGQAKTHVSVALYWAAARKQINNGPDCAVALAFPDDRKHLLLLEKISDALRTLKITVFLVDGERSVRRLAE